MTQTEAMRLATQPGAIVPVDIETTAALCAELRRLHAENEALRAMSFDSKRSIEDETLLQQALDTLAYWLEHGETPGSHDMIQRTHDALQERLK